MTESEIHSPNTSITWLGRLIADRAPEDWERLMAVYEPLLKSWTTRAGLETSDGDDVVQEVLLVVVRRIGEFERQRVGAFRSWLRSILANHLKRHFRDREPIASQIDLEALSQSDSWLARDLDREHDEFMARRAISVVRRDFSAVTWSAFQRQVIDGQEPAKVATELELTVNAVIKAKSRVLRRLRKELTWLIE